MTTFVEKFDRALYPTYARNWDDQLFRERILQHLTPTAVILDLGAGAGIVQHMDFRGLAARVCGVDLDPRVVDNPMLDEGQVADAGGIPWPDATFDIVFADNVLEHLPDPLAVFREIARVLKRGGIPVQNPQQNPLHAHPRPAYPAPLPPSSSTGFAAGPKPTPSPLATAPTPSPPYNASPPPAASPLKSSTASKAARNTCASPGRPTCSAPPASGGSTPGTD